MGVISDIGSQVADIARTQGELNALKAAQDKYGPVPADATEEQRQAYLAKLRDTQAYRDEMAKYGTGSEIQRGIQAALQGLAGGNLAGALAGTSAPELAHLLKSTEKDPAVNAIAHAVLGGAVAAMQGNNVAAGAAGAATGELAASNHIIAELYYCFAMTQIACLPLTQRPDDIEPLFRHYLCKACQRLNHPVPEVGKEMLKEMMRRMWPNNVRELASAAELFTVGVLPLAETANPLMHVGTPKPLDRRVEDAERQIITEALNIHQGRINEVAEYLQIPRKKLYLRMKKYGLSKEHYKI
ncbi:hypothetical protein ESCO105987_22720 [Escherichia coli]